MWPSIPDILHPTERARWDMLDSMGCPWGGGLVSLQFRHRFQGVLIKGWKSRDAKSFIEDFLASPVAWEDWTIEIRWEGES